MSGPHERTDQRDQLVADPQHEATDQQIIRILMEDRLLAELRLDLLAEQRELVRVE